jgi:hypothetical protein
MLSEARRQWGLTIGNMSAGRVSLSNSYVRDSEPIIAEQLAKAGARIAHLLNRAFAGRYAFSIAWNGAGNSS